MAPRASYSLDLPEREPDEPDVTEEQRAQIELLLRELRARESFGPRFLDALGTRQAALLVNALTDLRERAAPAHAGPGGSPLPAAFPWLVALGVVLLVLLVAFA
jgi:hypothetical protein